MPGDSLSLEVDRKRPERDAAAGGSVKRDIVESTDTPIDELLGRSRKSGNEPGPSYYDLSILKPPVWTPEVSTYFFLGGMSAGAFMIGRLAARFGGKEASDIARYGTYVAAAASLPCAPLLIVDLGDPKRFHHMLRIFKPMSPMNVGSWALTAYTGCAMLAALCQWVRDHSGRRTRRGAEAFAIDMGEAIADVAGIPMGLLLAAYTGVLLSTTSTPIWCKNPWLGIVFMTGAVGTGSAGIRLVKEAKKLIDGDLQTASTDRALETVSSAAHWAEAAAAIGFVAAAGKLAAPIITGPQAPMFLGGGIGAGILVPEIIEHLRVPRKAKPWVKLAGMAAALIGGLMLRHAFVQAGAISAKDPDAARESSRAKPSA